MNDLPLNAGYWDERYQTEQTSWDIGYISTPLKAYFDQLTNKYLAILIPGCGNSYEAEYLLQQGFTNITLIDIAPLLTEKLAVKFSQYVGRQLTIITGDFFALEGQYDLIIEQTFFCALQPSLRKDYMHKMYELLKPGGKLVGVLFNRTFEGGPPFGGSMEEYKGLFEQKFTLHTLTPCYNSIPPRSGAEVFMIARK
ncbi:methyltransferase [Pseudoflavitalea sp. X16]|uniref:methyltransferase n=1 Tax=Paraflavitalea devenefica TaxID=2716334 RepID=UPI0014221F59|nr:methyltransferase [Paraflavitalea devenefica]NII25783.1 methyltransferase [Paraflavitalea devenefica]